MTWFSPTANNFDYMIVDGILISTDWRWFHSFPLAYLSLNLYNVIFKTGTIFLAVWFNARGTTNIWSTKIHFYLILPEIKEKRILYILLDYIVRDFMRWTLRKVIFGIWKSLEPGQ